VYRSVLEFSKGSRSAVDTVATLEHRLAER
jgi:hypothetical protein